MEFKPINSHI